MEDNLGSQLDESEELMPEPSHRRGSQQRRPPPHRDKGLNTCSTQGHTSNKDEVSRWNRPPTPKLVFPSFDGVDPKIWRDKCEDYFRIMDIPEYMWVTTTSMHMNGNSAKWARVLRCKGGLGNWNQFMQAVDDKFGAYDYIHALENLLELKQDSTVEAYVEDFENLQFQIEMHNTGYDKMFFITQFTRGLKPEIAAMVHSKFLRQWKEQSCWPRYNKLCWTKGK